MILINGIITTVITMASRQKMDIYVKLHKRHTIYVRGWLAICFGQKEYENLPPDIRGEGSDVKFGDSD